ncbi:early light-induced protein 1, chloroplastic-like isoform X2 [Ananas comosus]|uniref:Early light-induced protein 1, chloroplastic-like isoform X2 n=1 Tax=Ananas comosus TaxID=4615 RepID=A0A6P5FK84_ANACO|nr:early light-induced protein 1, chloroplastic-like isoform X2 [Ananas comosus]
MACSAILSSYVAGIAPRVGLGRPALVPRKHALRVRCAGDQKIQDSAPTTPPSPTSTGPTTAPKPQPKVSTKFSDVLAFSGPAPERINGRLAMVGFVSAVAVEVAKGDGIFAQLSNGGVPWFLFTAALLSVASLVPLFRGESVQSRSGAVMSADAELWNGRFAMLGLVALAFTEYVKGGPLV